MPITVVILQGMKLPRHRAALYLLLLALALALLWKLSSAITLADVKETQQRLQRVQLTELDRQLNQLSYVPRLLSEDVEIRNALSTKTEAALIAANRRLARTQQDSGLDFAFLLNTEGLTVASSNWAGSVSFVGVSYSYRPYFKQAVDGSSATFFAVGATTGIPGYFIAEPVLAADQVIGVVVAKIALDILVDAWSQLPYESLVSDEFGGVILSTRSEWLYTPTTALSDAQKRQLRMERRYELEARELQLHDGSSQKRLIHGASGQEAFLLFSQPLVTEPWQLLSLVPEREIHRKAFVLLAMLASAAVIGFLLLRLYQQQRRLVRAEQHNSQELEEQVVRRTKELEQAQQRLISESNFAMLGRMSAAINHEINQPLASLRMNLASLRTMIDRPEADQAEITQIVVDSDRTTKRIGRVISSLRSLARKQDSQLHRVDVEKVIDDVHNTVQRERPTVSQCLVVRIEPGNYPIMGDEVLIQQALLNLLYNAFDAVLAIDNPQIELALEMMDKSSALPYADNALPSTQAICLSVSDNGEGVSASAAENLFQPFATTRGQHDGLGLGLTIARQIAEDHGGKLSYQARDVGSCFILMLPVAQPE